jgi:hypothetical protein
MKILAVMTDRRPDPPPNRKPYRGVTLDRLSIETVVDRLRIAAESGDAQAQLMLAKSLELGIGTPPDQQQAFRWYKKAAETAVNILHKEPRRTG